MNTSSSALLLTCLVSLGSTAQDSPERSDLGLVQRQITAIEQLVDRANSVSVDAVGARYRFDYSRFAADLERVRQGIHTYLSPCRAQPADMAELTGDYRTEASLARPSDEHD
ncbi:RAQPRD family integrative conjugative element protein [Pseudomonas putida]|uniref:integrative conjugative element protein, RAQPRD family n=1 Tax=Pseudomonas TaxID=286 RepID=UPI0018D7B1BD|nr:MULTISPECIES: RAQPRD family integrative conjugative element protein [Pseudomonas]MBH3371877.1 RAQPRD family integrative conjugative element protein [Pseudomonas juntendi]